MTAETRGQGRCLACGLLVPMVFVDGLPVNSEEVYILRSIRADTHDFISHLGCEFGDEREPRLVDPKDAQ